MMYASLVKRALIQMVETVLVNLAMPTVPLAMQLTVLVQFVKLDMNLMV